MHLTVNLHCIFIFISSFFWVYCFVKQLNLTYRLTLCFQQMYVSYYKFLNAFIDCSKKIYFIIFDSKNFLGGYKMVEFFLCYC